jgi:hypothetical protein
VGQLSDPFNQRQNLDLGFTLSGLPGEPDEPDEGPEQGTEGDDEEVVVFELDDWSDMERQAVTDRLNVATIGHGWDGTSLQVAGADAAAVDNIIDIVEGELNQPLDADRDRVAYDLTEWDDDQVAELVAALRAQDIASAWDGDELYVYADDEAAADEVFDQVAHPDQLDAEDDDGTAGADLLGEIFVAADRLQHDAEDTEGALSMLRLALGIDEAAAPYGFDGKDWERVREQVAELGTLLSEDTVDHEAVVAQARDLRSALRPFV